jgi:hypothetical protein
VTFPNPDPGSCFLLLCRKLFWPAAYLFSCFYFSHFHPPLPISYPIPTRALYLVERCENPLFRLRFRPSGAIAARPHNDDSSIALLFMALAAFMIRLGYLYVSISVQSHSLAPPGTNKPTSRSAGGENEPQKKDSVGVRTVSGLPALPRGFWTDTTGVGLAGCPPRARLPCVPGLWHAPFII